MLLLIIAVATFFSTFCGGLFALRLKGRLHLVLGFSAGAVIGVVFFDLLPEAIALGSPRINADYLLTCSAAGFLSYLVLDRVQWLRTHLGGGAGGLSAHSLVDGVAIGLGFQVSRPAGIVLAIAVVIHDFSDGVNTAVAILKESGDRRRALSWVWADALAPGVGMASTAFFSVPSSNLGISFAVFSGFFLYIGASDLIPESFHAHPTWLTTLLTLAGAATVYAAITLTGR